MCAYHTQYHRSIGMTPQEALYGYTAHVIPFEDAALPPATSLWERLQMLQSIHARVASTSDAELDAQRKLAKTRPSPAYDVGDLVKITNRMTHKLDPKWKGPFPIVRRVSTTSYEVKLHPGDTTHHIIHQAHLRPWYANDDAEDRTADADTTDADSDNAEEPHPDTRISSPSPREDPSFSPDAAAIGTHEDLSALPREVPTAPIEDPSPIPNEDPPASPEARPPPSIIRVTGPVIPPSLSTDANAPRRPLSPIEEEDPTLINDDQCVDPPRHRLGLVLRARTWAGRNVYAPAKYRD
jgi:hypothetical protein